ncbi:MAG: hypothetical protein ABIR71_11795 [Chthoniobacterales bacterium]
MKKFIASLSVALVTLPVAGFACGGGDCSGMELPAPPAPEPGAVENVVSVLSDNAGLTAGLVLAALVGYAIARQRKALEATSRGPALARGVS